MSSRLPDEQVSIERGADGAMRLKGAFTAQSVPAVLSQSEGWFEKPSELDVDLSGIRHSDSTGVALLLEWMRQAREQNCELHYLNVPAQMRAIINFGELGDVLPIEKQASE